MYITVSWHLLPSKSHLYISSKIWRSLAPRRLQWEYVKCNSISCWVPKMGDQVKIQLFMIPRKQQWFFKSSGDTFAGRPAICSSTRFGHCREAFSNANFQFGIFLSVFFTDFDIIQVHLMARISFSFFTVYYNCNCFPSFLDSIWEQSINHTSETAYMWNKFWEVHHQIIWLLDGYLRLSFCRKNNLES